MRDDKVKGVAGCRMHYLRDTKAPADIGLGNGLKVSDVTELAAGTALSIFLSALWHQRLLRC